MSLGVRVRNKDGGELCIGLLMIVLPFQGTRGLLLEAGSPNGELKLKVSFRNGLKLKRTMSEIE